MIFQASAVPISNFQLNIFLNTYSYNQMPNEHQLKCLAGSSIWTWLKLSPVFLISVNNMNFTLWVAHARNLKLIFESYLTFISSIKSATESCEYHLYLPDFSTHLAIITLLHSLSSLFSLSPHKLFQICITVWPFTSDFPKWSFFYFDMHLSILYSADVVSWLKANMAMASPLPA